MEKEDVGKNVADARPAIPPPVIVDLGSRSTKAIKKLKKGKGKLMADVDRAIEQASSHLSDDAKTKQIIPVLIIYKKKGTRKGGSFPCFPISPFSLLR